MYLYGDLGKFPRMGIMAAQASGIPLLRGGGGEGGDVAAEPGVFRLTLPGPSEQ